MKKILNALYQQQLLSHSQAREILINIAKGVYNPSEIASFLTVFMMRGVTVQELSGFREALLELCRPVDFNGIDTIDLCGTGGDEKNTFNISTLASFVVAGAGVSVAKHGNYGVSSVSGSSNVLEYLGYRFSNDNAVLLRQLEQAGICFMHAPLFHPAMKTVAPIRKELGVKTFFNMLGPLVNPARPKYQMSGVFSLELARMYHYIFQQEENQYAVVYDLGGYDECSLTNTTRLLTTSGEFEIEPSDFKFDKLKQADIEGGRSIAENAALFIDVLNNTAPEAHTQVVLANAAIALQCRFGESLNDSLLRAEDSLKSGNALAAFTKLIQLAS